MLESAQGDNLSSRNQLSQRLHEREEFGTGDPKLMSGGISQALITTQLGLAVAIPLVLFHSLLAGRANRLVEQLGKYCSDLVTDRELD